jgi:DnaJ-domain-containing protein 1
MPANPTEVVQRIEYLIQLSEEQLEELKETRFQFIDWHNDTKKKNNSATKHDRHVS